MYVTCIHSLGVSATTVAKDNFHNVKHLVGEKDKSPIMVNCKFWLDGDKCLSVVKNSTSDLRAEAENSDATTVPRPHEPMLNSNNDFSCSSF